MKIGKKRETPLIDQWDPHILAELIKKTTSDTQQWLSGATVAITDTSGGYTENMPQGLRNAMSETKNLRDWIKQAKAHTSYTGLGIGMNIRKMSDGYILNVSIGQTSFDVATEDSFALLEAIQEIVDSTLR